MLRLAESLVYAQDQDAIQRAQELSQQYLARVQNLSPAALAAKKDEIKHLRDVTRYLVKFNVIPPDAEAVNALEEIIRDQGWDKKK